MKLNATKLGLAAAGATLTAWVICSLAVAVAPVLTMSITGHLIHLDPAQFTWNLTLSGFAMGAICWTGFAFLFTWVLGIFYNGLLAEPASGRLAHSSAGVQ